MGVCVPEEHGGAGADFLAYMLVLEELSRADAGVGVTVAVHTSAGTLPILNHGSAEQIERLVPPLAAGEELAAFALTESGSGSDAARCARASADDRITGAKQWITNGSFASTFLVFAKEDERPSRVPRPRRRRGLQRHPRGGEDGAQLELHRRPRVRGHARPSGSASPATACASRCARSTAAGSGSPPRPSASPRPRSSWRRATPRSATRSAARSRACGAIQQKLADMQTEIEAARALVWRAARLKEAGKPAQRRGRAGQAVRLRRRPPPDRRGDPDPRRLRLHQGVPGRALLPRRQGHRDLRGHERDPAARHRPRAAR